MLRLESCEHLVEHAPSSWRKRAVHLDPDLMSEFPTYGDNCRTAGRAYSLRSAQPKDLIVFLARLHDTVPGFFLVGTLEIEDSLIDVVRDPGPGWWDSNAHIRRSRATGDWNSFWVFKGTRNSRLFARAIPFTRREAITVFGDGWMWREGRTELQTIGSYTRAIRRIEGTGEHWLRTISLS